MKGRPKTGGRSPASFVLLLPIVLALAVSMPQDAQAQIRLVPALGLYAPLSELGEVREGGASTIQAGRRSSTLALGLGLELGSLDGTANLRAEIAYATSSDVPLDAVGCADCELRSTLLTGSVAAVIRPLPSLILLRPYLVAGVGLKRYDFERDDLNDEGFTNVFRNQTRPALQLGVGSDFRLGPISPRLELATYISRLDALDDNGQGEGSDDLQTDLFLMLSLPLSLGGR